MIKATTIADSINPNENRITSFILIYPRFFHQELLTHRIFSRNASSSRAIPIQKMIDDITINCVYPLYWASNKPGMQSGEPLENEKAFQAASEWDLARQDAVQHTKKLAELGVHKSIANRIIEPFMHMTTLLTGTDFENFFALRAHESAQPEFEILAYKMLDQYIHNTPVKMNWGEWHIPFGDKMPDLSIEEKLKVATARAARISYKTFDGEINVEKDFVLHDRLKQEHHMSPLEHPAQATEGRWGNFEGWKSYRKMIPDENIRCNLQKLWDNRSDRVKRFLEETYV